VGKRAEVDRLAPQLLDALEKSRIVDGPRIERIGAGHTWAFAAIEEPDPTCACRFASDDEAFVVVNGPALAADGNQPRLAANLLKKYRDGGSTEVSDSLEGAYNFVGVAPGIGLHAFGDFSGMYPLYWHSRADFAVLSNRSLTISDLVGSREWDPRALAWVIARANLAGDGLPLRNVRHLPSGTEARAAWGTGALELHRNSSWIWPSTSDDAGRDNLTSTEWDDVTAELVGNVRALEAVDAPLRLSLTGGKDSRLCLAIVKAAGLRDCVDVYTNGVSDSPEAQVARAVAEAAGYTHRTHGAGMNTPPAPAVAARKKTTQPDVDVAKVWQRLRCNVTRYEAMVPPWAALQNPTFPPFVNIKGFGGEFFRRGSDGRYREKEVPSVDELASRFATGHLEMDRLGIIRPAEAAYQAQWLESWVHETAREMRLDVVHEKFHVDTALAHWSGPLLQCAPQRVNINPLVSRGAAAKNLELSAAARRSERFHFEVMCRAAPELVLVPFLNDVWAPELAAGSSFELPQSPFATAVKPTGRVLHQGNPGWRFFEIEGKAIDQLFREASKRTDMGAVCDMKKLRRYARSSRPLTRFGEIREMVGAVGTALTLLDRAGPVV
jgi:hypothetical protein